MDRGPHPLARGRPLLTSHESDLSLMTPAAVRFSVVIGLRDIFFKNSVDPFAETQAMRENFASVCGNPFSADLPLARALCRLASMNEEIKLASSQPSFAARFSKLIAGSPAIPISSDIWPSLLARSLARCASAYGNRFMTRGLHGRISGKVA